MGQAGSMGREASCARNGKWITSLAAMLHLIRAPSVRDALVLVTLTRPATSSYVCPLLLFLARLLPVMVSLVLPQLGQAVVCPVPYPRASDFLCNWLRNQAFADPPVQGCPMNSQQPRRFRNRVSLHKYATSCRTVSSIKLNFDCTQREGAECPADRVSQFCRKSKAY